MKANSYFVKTLLTALSLFLLPKAYGYVWPIDVGQSNAPLTSPFGPRRYPATEPYYDFHYGVDIRTTNSTTAVAIFEGYIIWTGVNGDYGRMTFLGDQDGIEDCIDLVGYAHLSNDLGLQEHDSRYEGQQIATTGSNHLHFNNYFFELDPNEDPPEHPSNADTDHPMFLLPYTDDSGPSSPVNSRTAEGGNGYFTSITFDVEIDDEELDLNYIELRIGDETEVSTDFGWQEDVRLQDGVQPSPLDGSIVIYSTWGYIVFTITVNDFNPGTNQRMTINYDFTNYQNGEVLGSLVRIDIKDVFSTHTITLTDFSAGNGDPLEGKHE